ncbi:glutathione hydrolase 6-like isoform X2 [Leptopilina boulardi]|uniref:glutathione hydrolase 6-like isoform X2 n=1 Tax=Leptopilina boulardi TaxID=63433 RepID=UPI0021F50FA8|nr:glutathione hydrolase 6-like isoform X2 [Leptopilina boulardi]
MHFIIRQPPTEEDPLTKERSDKCCSCKCSKSGFGIICCCFFILTVAITAALILQLRYGDNIPQGTIVHGAVASDYTNCSQIGTKILRKGGNSIDAAIAATICMTVVAPHITGLGGGGFMMIYNQRVQETPVIVDFVKNTVDGQFGKANTRIPGLLRALEIQQALRGKLSWQELIEPSIALARNGFIVSREFANEISKQTDYEKIFKPIYGGETFAMKNLANTLEIIAQHGADVIYNGSLSISITQKIGTDEALLNDLANYKPQEYTANKIMLFEHTIFYPPHENLLELSLRDLDKLHIQKINASTIETQKQVADTLINGNLISQDLNISQRKYTGVVAIDWQDTYVSIVTGLNKPLNLSLFLDIGFFLDTVDDVDELMTLTPILFHDNVPNCGLSGSFNSDDPIVTGQILYNYLARGMNLSTTIESARYYLLPDGVTVEPDSTFAIDTAVTKNLNIINSSRVNGNSILKSINMITKRGNTISSHSDSRGEGLASRF